MVTRPFNREKAVFSTNGAGKTGYLNAKTYRVGSLLRMDLNLRVKTVKLLEENTGNSS